MDDAKNGKLFIAIRHSCPSSVLSYSGYPGGAENRFTFADLPERIDHLLITHNHQDHMLFETLLRIRHRVGRVLVPKSTNASLVDPGLGGILRRLGFTDVVEVDDLETLSCGSAEVVALPFLGEHGDLRIRSKTGWLIRFGERSVLFAADSTNISPTMYTKVAEVIGPVDTVFIGMESIGAAASWIYGPLYGEPLDRRTDQSRRLNGSNFPQAREIVDALEPDEVYVYAMGLEPWMGVVMAVDYDESHPAIVDSDLLVRHVQDKGGTAERLHELNAMGTTICVITHDNEIANSLPRRVRFKDGEIVADERPDSREDGVTS